VHSHNAHLRYNLVVSQFLQMIKCLQITYFYSSQVQSCKTLIGCQVLIPIQLYELNQTDNSYIPWKVTTLSYHVWIEDLVQCLQNSTWYALVICNFICVVLTVKIRFHPFYKTFLHMKKRCCKSFWTSSNWTPLTYKINRSFIWEKITYM